MQLASRHETAKPPMALCEAQAQAWSEAGVQTEEMAAERQGLWDLGWGAPKVSFLRTRVNLLIVLERGWRLGRQGMLCVMHWRDGNGMG